MCWGGRPKARPAVVKAARAKPKPKVKPRIKKVVHPQVQFVVGEADVTKDAAPAPALAPPAGGPPAAPPPMMIAGYPIPKPKAPTLFPGKPAAPAPPGQFYIGTPKSVPAPKPAAPGPQLNVPPEAQLSKAQCAQQRV